MIYYEYRRKDGYVFGSNFAPCREVALFINKERENIQIRNARNLYAEYAFGSVRVLIVDEPAYLASSKLAKKILEAFVSLAELFLKSDEQSRLHVIENMKLFGHNLVTVGAQLKDKIERVFDESVMRVANYKEQKELVKKRIGDNLDRAADDFCQIAKRVADLSNQIVAFKVLSGQAPKPNFGRFNIKKMILRHAQPFFMELGKSEIEFLSVNSEFERSKVFIDPQLMSVALHHFFNNATKYIYPDSPIKVSMLEGETSMEVSIGMTSVLIEKDELNSVFERGISGRNVGSLAGQGIGMYVIRQSLNHFGGSIRIEPDYTANVNYAGRTYTLNKFIISLPKPPIRS